VISAEQRRELDLGIDLLATLADRRAGGVFVVVYEPAGQAPEPIPGFDGAPPEHDAAVRLDHHRGRDLRVAPQDEVVVGTCLELTSLDRPRNQRSTAVEAEVAHGRRD
jgi:hypothetical protein